MDTAQQKVVQYLNEAHATEQALVRVLQSQIAMTPRGSLSLRRSRRTCARRATTPRASAAASRRSTRARTRCWPPSAWPRPSSGRSLALGKTPFDLLRGSGGEEKVLKNAKDACATEALEIATYTALERLARSVGDDETADAGRVDPRRRGEDARAHPARDPEADRRRSSAPTSRASPPTTSPPRAPPTPSARPARRPRQAARKTAAATSAPRARHARSPASLRPRVRSRAPWPPRDDLAIARYDALTADEITSRLAELSQIDLAKVDVLRAQEPEPHHDPRAASARCAATSRGPATTSSPPPRSRPCSPTARRRAIAQAGPLLRARPQEPRRRPQGRRARAQQRLTIACAPPRRRPGGSRAFAVRMDPRMYARIRGRSEASAWHLRRPATPAAGPSRRRAARPLRGRSPHGAAGAMSRASSGRRRPRAR